MGQMLSPDGASKCKLMPNVLKNTIRGYGSTLEGYYTSGAIKTMNLLIYLGQQGKISLGFKGVIEVVGNEQHEEKYDPGYTYMFNDGASSVPIGFDPDQHECVVLLTNEEKTTDMVRKLKLGKVYVYIDPKIGKIGDSFLEDCRSLKSVIFLPTSVTSVGSGCLSICGRLEYVDFSGLEQVETIGDRLLCNCTGLMAVTLTGMPLLRSIGYECLFYCTALKTATFDLCTLEEFGDNFISKCVLLTNVTFDLPALQIVKDFFLSSCVALTELKLTGMPVLRSIGDGCLMDCISLTAVTFDLSALETVGSGFLKRCTALTEVKLAPSLQSIGDGCLSSCTSLKTVTCDLHALKTVGTTFLHECHALTEVNFTEMPKLCSIGNTCLAKCISLKTVTCDLPALETIGDRFLCDCPELKAVSLNLPSLSTVGNMFLAGRLSLLTKVNMTKVEIDKHADKTNKRRNESNLFSPTKRRR